MESLICCIFIFIIKSFLSEVATYSKKEKGKNVSCKLFSLESCWDLATAEALDSPSPFGMVGMVLIVTSIGHYVSSYISGTLWTIDLSVGNGLLLG